MRMLFRTFVKAPLVSAAFGVGAASFISWKLENAFKFNSFPGNWFGTTVNKSNSYSKQVSIAVDSTIAQDNALSEDHKGDIAIGNDLCLLSQKWMEIHTLVSSLSDSSTMNLPSIVVIGSQSSGKSSLLEAIVGQEFLPKGNHLVTRRPIKLNLIHTKEEEYGEFPELGIGRITSFSVIKTKLEELNKAVSHTEFVTATPIVLNIYSRNVPNLSLIDLPGYIQITTKDQPIELKEKISSICDTYIKEPNVILAISAADVDLANSEALRAAKIADPSGDRTIGVLTKMDLILPQVGVELLKTQDFELPLGFIGVVCSLGNNSDSKFFGSKSIYAESSVGINHLRNRLSNILEAHLYKSLKSFKKHIQSELINTDYQIKARFNGITPQTYLLTAIDSFKFNFQSFASSLKQSTLRNRIDAILFERVSDVCRKTVWNKDPADISVNHEAINELSRSGMAKECFDDIRDFILEEVESLLQQNPWNYHKSSQQKIIEIVTEILEAEGNDLIHQIENMIEPLKSKVEFNTAEWKIGKSLTSHLLQSEISNFEQKLADLSNKVQSKRELRKAMRCVSKSKYDYIKAFFKDFDCERCPVDLIETSKQAIELEEYLFKIWNRNYFLDGKSNSSTDCPDVYLSLIADRLASISSLFIAHHLSNRVLNTLPRSVEAHFTNLSSDQIFELSKENPEINLLLQLNHQRSVLTQTLAKITELQ